MILSVIAAIATVFVLPTLSYLVVRRDQKIDEAERKLHEISLAQVRAEGEIKGLGLLAAMVRENVTRREFETAMQSVGRSLDEIKDALKDK